VSRVFDKHTGRALDTPKAPKTLPAYGSEIHQTKGVFRG